MCKCQRSWIKSFLLEAEKPSQTLKITEISFCSPESLSTKSVTHSSSVSPKNTRRIWKDEASSGARVWGAALAPVFSGIRAPVSVTKYPCGGKDCSFCGVFTCLYFHLQAQIAKGGSNWLTDYWTKAPFKEMSLRINRQNYQLLAHCWFTVENHLFFPEKYCLLLCKGSDGAL